MSVVTVVPDVSWYDTFWDAIPGATSVDGWTKYGAGGLVVVSDSAAYGGRALSVETNAEFGLGLDIAGSPENFEVAVRFRASGESDEFNPLAICGGPGGRITDDTYLGGVMVGMECTAQLMTCEFFCSLGYVTAEYPDWAGMYHYRGDLNRLQLLSGSGTSTPVGTNSAYGKPVNLLGLYGDGIPAFFLVPGPAGTTCTSEYRQGLVASQYFWAKLRIKGTKVSFKYWAGDTEPAGWDRENIEITSNFWPASAGPVGILTPRNEALTIYAPCYSGQDGNQVKTLYDVISVSLDPDNEPATIPDPVTITSTCPLPPAKRGEAYSYQIESTVPVI